MKWILKFLAICVFAAFTQSVNSQINLKERLKKTVNSAQTGIGKALNSKENTQKTQEVKKDTQQNQAETPEKTNEAQVTPPQPEQPQLQ